MLAKPAAVIVPVVAGVLDVWVMKRGWRAVAKGVMGWLVLAVPIVVVARVVQTATGTFKPPLWARPVVALDALAFYARQVAAPLWLSMDYGRSPKWLLGAGGAAARYWTWLVPVAIGAAVWAIRRKAIWPLVGAAVFGAAVLPILGLTVFDFQFYSTVADHYVYVAMLGPALVVAWAVSRWRGRVVKVCAVAVLVALGVRSHVRTYDWRDSETLFAATLKVNPRSLPANINNGNIFAERAVWAKTPEEAKALNEEALGWYNRVLANDATNFHAHTHVGGIYEREGRLEEAAAHYRIAVDNDPAEEGSPHMLLGNVLMRLGRQEEAAAEYRRVMELPEDADHLNRGVAGEKLAEIERWRREKAGASAPASVAPGTRP
jgi:hypothetical protein